MTISGNYASTRGGGIGNNGNVRIGTRWDINARKVWDDGNDADGIRPSSVKLKLRATVVYEGRTTEIPAWIIPEGDEAVLSEANDWSHTWTDLPEVVPDDNPEVEKYKNLEITYTVEEADVPEGYTSKVSGNMFRDYVVTNTHEPETVSIPVEKKWDDEGRSAARPGKITVILHDGHGERELELSAANGWNGAFEDLPVYRGGERIKYTVTEKNVPDGYKFRVEGDAGKAFSIINTYEKPKHGRGTETGDRGISVVMLSAVCLLSLALLLLILGSRIRSRAR